MDAPSWRKASPRVTRDHGKLLATEVEQLRERLAAKHPVFGDRSVELTLIGLPDACRDFMSALQSALCTEEEIDAWRRGETFEDPWPRSLRAVR